MKCDLNRKRSYTVSNYNGVPTEWQNIITSVVYNAQALATIEHKLNFLARTSRYVNPLETNQLLKTSTGNTIWGLGVNQDNFTPNFSTHILDYKSKLNILAALQVAY